MNSIKHHLLENSRANLFIYILLMRARWVRDKLFKPKFFKERMLARHFYFAGFQLFAHDYYFG